jgi:predicted nucleotidyltransferase
MQLPVQNKKELIERILASEKEIRSYGVKHLGIFGSFVRDEAKENSDIDFFIDFDIEYKTLKNFLRLADILEELTGRKIEIVTPQSLSKYIGPYILKEVEYVPFAA